MTSAALIRRRRSSASLLSLYSALGIRPELAFDFANERYFTSRVPTTFSDAITHTRASTATYVDSSGVLQTAASGEPRVGHHVWNGSAWVNEGLLHESEARTNIVTQSEDFTSGGWTPTNVAATVNDAVAPDGASTADRIVENAATGNHNLILAPTIVANTSHTVSVFVKAGSGSDRALRVDFQDNIFTNGFRVLFNPQTGVIVASEDFGAGTLIGTSVETFANGWYRVSVSGVIDAVATSGRFIAYLQSNLTAFSASYTGDSSSNLLLWGAQLEEGPTPSSYIPTTGSAVTRAADVLTIPSANLPWPSPVVIGSELVTNGDFSNGTTGWTPNFGATLSISNGALRVEEDGVDAAGARASQIITTEIGKVYQVSVDLVDTNDDYEVYISNSTAFGGALASSTGLTAPQTIELFFVATSTSTYVLLGAGSAVVGTYCEYDNISVREINPLAVSIQMDGAINYADEGVAAQQTFLRWQLDANNYISVDLDTDSTATGEVNFNQAASGTVDTVATSGTALAPSIATAFNIASRHGSTFINGALNGTALTADTTPIALANLSATDFNIGHDYNGTIKTLRIWAQDIGDAGLAGASA